MRLISLQKRHHHRRKRRNPKVFELIFLFYQSDGRYCYRPPHIDLHTFCDEIMFFGLYDEYKPGPTVGLVKCDLDFTKFSQKALMGMGLGAFCVCAV